MVPARRSRSYISLSVLASRVALEIRGVDLESYWDFLQQTRNQNSKFQMESHLDEARATDGVL